MTDPELLQAARRLFDTEAEVLYALGSHDQIPQLFAHFEEEQNFFLVQEFIDGEVFSQELQESQPFTELGVIHLLQDVLTVLEFVHGQQVVHRDIKPSNIIRRSSDRQLVLIDFGAVKQASLGQGIEGQSTITIAVGSAIYMPSEQLAGTPRFASDIYALGILAIQCLTGLYGQKLPEDPQTSEILWRDRVMVSPELAEILDKMVRYDFRQRYPSAKETLADLQALVGANLATFAVPDPTSSQDDGHLGWLERGDELFQKQRYREAVNAYNKVIQMKPDSDLAWFKRGIALENLQFYEDAAVSFEQVSKLRPQDYLAWYKQGCAYEHLHRYAKALQAYEQVVQLQPDNYWVWHDRGKVLEQLQCYEEAVASYDRAVQLKPDFQLAVDGRKRLLSQLKQVDTLYHLQHYDEAVESCDRAIQQNPQDTLAWFMRGMALENLQRDEEALMAYQKVVEVQADDHLAWFKQGTLFNKLHQHEQALEAYHRVVQLQPQNYWAWHDRGKLLEMLGRVEEAIVCYDRVIQLKSDFQAALEGRARILQNLHQTVPAPAAATSPEEDDTIVPKISAIRSPSPSKTTQSHAPAPHETLHPIVPNGPVLDNPALQEHPLHAPISHTPIHGPVFSESVSLTLGLGLEPVTMIHSAVESLGAELVTGIHSVVEAETTAIHASLELQGETMITQVVHHLPEETASELQFQEAQSQAQSQEAQSQEARSQEAQSQISDSEDYLVWFGKGRALEKLQKYPEAFVALNRAIQLCDGDPELWSHHGSVLTLLGRHQDAAISYKRAVQLKPTQAELWCRLGHSLFRLKCYQEAAMTFSHAIKIKPNRHIPWYWHGRSLLELKRYSAAIQSFERAIALNPDFQPAISDCKRTKMLLEATSVTGDGSGSGE
jgi:tetratricopeptide (TPR) repeat protein